MADEHDLHAVIQTLRVTVAELSVTVKSLAGTISTFQSTFVTRDAHEALRADLGRVEADADSEIARVDTEAKAGIRRNDERWSRLAWFVGLAVLGALLGTVLIAGKVIAP